MTSKPNSSRAPFTEPRWKADESHPPYQFFGNEATFRSMRQRPVGKSRSSIDGRLAAAGQLFAAGRLAEALASMTEAATLRPDDAAIQIALGRLHLKTGQPGSAVVPLRRAAALEPRGFDAPALLGEAMEALEDSAEAIAAYRTAVSLRPSLWDVQTRLGDLLEGQGRLREAAECFRRAASSSPKGDMRLIAQARAAILENDVERAELLLRRAARRSAPSVQAQIRLGGLLSEAGRFDEAAELYEAAIMADPRNAGLHYDLLRCRSITPADRALTERMDVAVDTPRLPAIGLSRLHLARGKAFDDLGRHDRAMEAYGAAYAARARRVRFDLAAHRKRCEEIVGWFTSRTFARLGRFGGEDATPILIVGMPRSGTTLVEQIISAHPAAVGGGELPFWVSRVQNLRSEADLDGDFIQQAALAYLERLREISPDAARVTDKNPFNFMSAGLIHLAFPRAAIIHCRRRPIDTVLSIHQTHFSAGLRFPTGGEDLVGYYRAYEVLTAHWRRMIPSDRLLEIEYETLTADPEGVIPQIIAHAGLAWDDRCLRPQDNARLVKTPSRWQVRNAINRGSVDRWRRYEPWLGPLAALLDAPEDALS